MRLFRCNELSTPQNAERSLNGAFGKACSFRDVPKARRHRTPAAARRQAIQVQINKKCGRVFVVAHQVTH